jgi:hypothetical protein
MNACYNVRKAVGCASDVIFRTIDADPGATERFEPKLKSMIFWFMDGL